MPFIFSLQHPNKPSPHFWFSSSSSSWALCYSSSCFPRILCFFLQSLQQSSSSTFTYSTVSCTCAHRRSSPAKLLRRDPAAPLPPPTSCPVFIMTDIDQNFTTSVANASHGGSGIWSVDLLFFEASWVQAGPRLFPFYYTAYHFFSLLGDSPKNQFFFSGWLKAVQPILWSSFCHAALHLLQSK